MAVPTFVGVGSIATSAAAVAAAFPGSMAIDDIIYIGVESFGTDPAPTLSGGANPAAAGYTKICDQVQGGTRLTVFRGVATSATPTAPTISDTGDHQCSRTVVVRGADTADPNETPTLGVDTTSDTSGTMPAHTTAGADRLVLLFATSDLPDSTGTAEYSWTSFGNLASGAERSDNSVASGNGGSLSWATGTLASAGAIGTITYTKANAGVKAHAVIAVKEPAAAGTTYEETGSLTAGTASVGADVAEHARTGALTPDTSTSGADVAEHPRAGSLTTRATAAGADVAEHPRAGSLAAGSQLRGADVFEAVETGSLTTRPILAGPSEKVGSGPTTYEKTGALTAGTQPRAADVAERAETGTLAAGTRPTATDQYTAAETGSLLVDTLLAGLAEHVGPQPEVVPGSVTVRDAEPVHVETGTLPGGIITVLDVTGIMVRIGDTQPVTVGVVTPAGATVTIEDQEP